MRRRKRDLWKTGITVASMLFLLVLMVLLPVSSVAAYQQGAKAPPVTGVTVTVQATPTEDATVMALNKEKLTREVSGLQHTGENWLWSNAATILSSFLSTLAVAVAGVLELIRKPREGDKLRENQERSRCQERARGKSVINCGNR